MNRWDSMPLADCLEKSPKAVKIPKKKFLGDGAYPIVSQEQNLINGYWDDASAVIHTERPLIVYGDHTQVVKFIDFDFVVGADGVKLLIPKSFLYPRYFYYFLLTSPVKSLGYARHFRLVKKLQVAFPPLAEQKRIVAILDQAFAGIDKVIAHTEKNLANARELFEGCLNTTFRDLNDRYASTCLADLFNIKSSKRVLKSQWRDEGVPFYRGREITKLAKHGHLNNDLFISEELFREFREQHGVPAPGDIMITAIGTIGNSYIVKGSDRFYFKDASVLWLDKFTDIDSSFANYWLQSHSFHEQLKKDNGATVDTLTIGTLKTTRIPVPSVVEQGNIAKMLDAIKDQTDHLELAQRRKLTALTDLKQSLLHKAFNGELTADPQRETQAALP